MAIVDCHYKIRRVISRFIYWVGVASTSDRRLQLAAGQCVRDKRGEMEIQESKIDVIDQ